MVQNITEEQKQQLQSITVSNGIIAWEYVLSAEEDDQYWVAVGILACVEHGYGLNRLTINWETRNLRREKSQ